MNPDYDNSPISVPVLRQAIKDADIVALALAVIYLTDDMDLLARIECTLQAGTNPSKTFSSELTAEVWEKAERILAQPRAERPAASRVDPDTLGRMIRLATGNAVSDEYFPMLIDQAGLKAATPVTASIPTLPPHKVADFRVAVIGAGMSGLCAAIELAHQGIPFTVFEKNPTVGGTWHENAYPGCGVDTPSFFYAYSFEQNPNWSHYFAKRQEIAEYFEGCADKYGIRDRIQFNAEVTAAVFCEERQLWEITARSEGGESVFLANAVITAVGQLNRPAIPSLPGLESFNGPVMHTAEWAPSVDVTGKRVAMIGTGASGMQVAPAIAPQVKNLAIFQRSPHWVLANPFYHRKILRPQKWLQANLPSYLNWLRLQMIWTYGDAIYPAIQVDPEWKTPDVSLNAINERYRQNMIRHIQREIGDDPELLAKTIPDYPPYGKRVLLDNHWFKMLKRDNVDLFTGPIKAIEPGAVVTRDGQRHEADVIVLATGFQASRMLWPVNFRGRDGISLRELWGDDNPRAYLGISIPRFPNLFVLYGPNTNLAFGGSAIFNAECQARYAVSCIRALIERNWASIECRQDVHDAYNAEVDRMHGKMVWARENVTNWYRNGSGRVTTNTPWRLVDYWSMTRHPDFKDYIVRAEAVRGAPAPRKISS